MYFLDKLKIFLKSSFLKNLSILAAIQILNVIIPIALYPFIFAKIGTLFFGQIILAQSITNYIITITNFGFEITGPKKYAETNNDRDVSILFSSIFFSMFLIFAICFTLTMGLSFFSPSISQFRNILFFTLIQVISDIIVPSWFYISSSRVKEFAANNFISKMLYFILVLVFIKSPTDSIKIPIFYSSSRIIISILSLTILLKKTNIRIIWNKLSAIKDIIISSFSFFLSRTSAIIQNETNTILIGVIIGVEQVPIYDISKKIVNLFIMPFSLVNQLIYPQLAKSKIKSHWIFLFYTTLFISILSVIMIFFFGELFIKILSKGVLSNTKPFILYILSLQIPFIIISFFSGNTILVINNYHKEFNYSSYIGLISYLAITSIIYLTVGLSVTYISITIVFSSFIVASYRISRIIKYNLL